MLSITLRLGGNACHKTGAATAKTLSSVVSADLIQRPARVLLPTDQRLYQDCFDMLVFEERGKPEYPEKNLSDIQDNQQQTQATYCVESENRSRATSEGGECSHHCAIPALQVTPNEVSRHRRMTINVTQCPSFTTFQGN